MRDSYHKLTDHITAIRIDCYARANPAVIKYCKHWKTQGFNLLSLNICLTHAFKMWLFGTETPQDVHYTSRKNKSPPQVFFELHYHTNSNHQ